MSALPRVTSTAAEAQAAARCTSELSHLHAARSHSSSKSKLSSTRLKTIAVSGAALEAEMDAAVPLNTRKELAAERAMFTTFR
jgi:hypothetical protein